MAKILLRVLPLLFAAACALLPGHAPASVLVLTDASGDHPAGLHLAYFADNQRTCHVECARARFAAGDAVRSTVATPNLGLTGSYWFALTVHNQTGDSDWTVEADAPYLDEVLLYNEQPDGTTRVQRDGDMLRASARPLRNRNIAFPITLPPGTTTTLLLRVTNQGPVTLPLHVQTRHTFATQAGEENLAYGIYFGILGGIALYNLMIFLIMRDRNHLYYVLYIASFGLTMATVYGFSALYIWPEDPWWSNRAVPVSVLTSGFFVILFARGFLSLQPSDIRHRAMSGMLAMLPLLLPLALFAPFGVAVRVIYVFAIACSSWLLFIGIDQVLRGNRAARYFMLAWIALLVSVVVFLLNKLGLLPTTDLTEYGILVGSALESILLSIALAHRFAIIRDESIQLQGMATANLEQRVEERTRELDHALRTRSEFLATVSHEIRTPMNGVLGITELMLDTELTPRQREYAQIIQSSGRTLLIIINDVLDYSKIDAGKMSLENVPFRLLNVLNGAVQIFRAEAERKKLRFVTAIDPDVPEEIMGDPVRLQQVLNNLLSNALKFTDDGEIRLTAHREVDGKLTFSVSDTGIGIDASIQPRLFDAFDQGDQSMTRRFGGTGLGLAISRRLVDLMGGSISFESDLGRGTTFYFTIPVKTVGSGAYSRISAEGALPGNALHLLVVDDNAVNLQVAAGLLRRLGHVVETVESGPQAIERLFAASTRFDAVFMDCEMPGMDGYVATRAIRQREKDEALPHTMIVALTAHVFSEKIAACHAVGMDDHLAKPLNPKLLAQMLTRIAQARP